MRGLLPTPSILPPSLPSKSDLVSLGDFPPSCLNQEASTRFSGFLFSKLIPKNQDPDLLLKSYGDKLSQSPLDDPMFKSALSNFLIPTFRRGWDKHYERQVRRHVLSNGAVREGGKCSEWDLHRSEFVDFCLSKPPPAHAYIEVQSKRAYAIPDSGKLRLITVSSKWQHLLAPLHHTIYTVLTNTGTVLRGSPLPSTFEGFKSQPEDPICSGDFEASTDNLSALHADFTIRRLRETSTHVPSWIWDLALASLTGHVTYKTRDGTLHSFVQRTGQLMGNFLSFPLLCISNLSTLFLAFGSEEAWRMIWNGLVVVNGDDIVFKAPQASIDVWLRALPHSGFVINPTKTSIHMRYFTLNSKLFHFHVKRIKKVWHLIPKGLFKKTDTSKDKDFMVAHSAAMRESLKGVSSLVEEKIRRALSTVKKNAVLQTSIKVPALGSEREYQGVCGVWKLTERIKGWDQAFNPKKEKLLGIKIYGIDKEKATKKEREESMEVCAEARFTKLQRPTVESTNDRWIQTKDFRDAQFFLYQKLPRYVSREKEWVWVKDKPLPNSEPIEFFQFVG
jgi:hypothetical protein